MFEARTKSRLKRRMLAQAVASNLREVNPHAPSRRRGTLGVWLAVVAVVVAAGTWGFVAAKRSAPRTTTAATADLPAPVASISAAPLRSGPLPRISSNTMALGVRRVVLDPGHGGGDLGTQASATLIEKDLALDLARRTRERLVAAGIEVVLTRDADVAVALRDRAEIANRAEADLFVSIHLNWLDPSVAERGVETYLLGATDDPHLEALAESENSGSGYSFADVRRLLDGIYLDMRQESSRRLAAAIHAELLGALRQDDPQLRDRGVKSAPFLVLVETGVPAVLAEVGCLSHSRDAERLADPAHRDRIATALAAGIRRYARRPEPSGGPS